MKIVYSLIIICFLPSAAFSQYSVRGGMGIDLISSQNVVDYVNYFATPGNLLGNFNTAVSFSAEGDYFVKNNFQIGVEVAYMLNSYTYLMTDGKFELSYHVIMPTFVGYYVIPGSGYNFKFGGGAGIRLLGVSQTIPPTTVATDYSSIGFGLLLCAEGNTLLSGNLYANVGATIRYDFNGSPKNGSGYIVDKQYNEKISFNSLSVGLRLGVSYYF